MLLFFFSSRRRHTSCALVTGVQTCALPIFVADISEMDQVKAGDILVTDMTDPNWEPVMKLASAIVTNRGGRTCHAAIIARELGIPAVEIGRASCRARVCQ